ncbi:Nan1p Ecym_8312 [Eremothecium cymbalariae DBVPG|uniref:Uncharacterized protein n=1 Tax=Eremothecium cymbalariae (strain CBS 270.75 / DBVPG 7215 / KCTC 17166 / NRRL Y-17582) TaxID=931890 RepID=G8JXL6_ERECY|nr:Hypothetical protein Ecym_8312 [Eremothecium cymbalariae DBVPG\
MHENYKLSVVSGGKPLLPRIGNRSSTIKTVNTLMRDQENYVVSFNNQLKIYSIETRQCVKTLKFSNNHVLNKIFGKDDAAIVIHISLNDGSTTKGEESKASDEIRLVSDRGDLVLLKYRGKLLEDPTHSVLAIPDGETIFKVFEDERGTMSKLFTIVEDSSSTYTYKLHACKDGALIHLKTYENVLLSTWSRNDQFFALLVKGEDSRRYLIVESLVDEEYKKYFPLPVTHASASANANYVTSMALDSVGKQLALGFASGVITLISTDDYSFRLLKWHIDAVLSMAFNIDSTYLLSGGWEKVVSFWQLSTNLQQFLPRLNGVVVDCNTVGDKYFSLALQMTENTSNTDYQLLLLNFTDLTTRLAINGPLAVFQSAVKDAMQPLSAVNTKTSTSAPKMHLSKKKHARKLIKGKRQDFTTVLQIHPQTKQLYFPHKSAVQIYDFYKNEQISYQYIASGINNAMGKVRGELNLQDPEVYQLHFTKDGKWMITYEVEKPPEGLLSSKDLTHILKFWNLDDKNGWQLKTKVLNPHGTAVPIAAILVAPQSTNGSQSCLTASNNGDLKCWSFDTKENNWCLIKISPPKFNHFSNNVSLAWSRDGSLIFHAFDDRISIVVFTTFKIFESESKSSSTISLDSAIQCMKLVDDTMLIIATKTSLNFWSLLSGSLVNCFDIYPFVQGMYKPGHMSRLLSCDEDNNKIAFVINEQQKDKSGQWTTKYKSRVLMFSLDSSERLGSFEHDEYISSIAWNHDTDFIFIDTQCRLGVVSTTTTSEMLSEINGVGALELFVTDENDFERQLKDLSKQNENKIILDETVDDINLEIINGQKEEKLINMNSFTSMFENIDNIQLGTLFDRVMKVIS